MKPHTSKDSDKALLNVMHVPSAPNKYTRKCSIAHVIFTYHQPMVSIRASTFDVKWSLGICWRLVEVSCVCNRLWCICQWCSAKNRGVGTPFPPHCHPAVCADW